MRLVECSSLSALFFYLTTRHGLYVFTGRIFTLQTPKGQRQVGENSESTSYYSRWILEWSTQFEDANIFKYCRD